MTYPDDIDRTVAKASRSLYTSKEHWAGMLLAFGCGVLLALIVWALVRGGAI